MRPARAHNFGTYFVTAGTWERRQLFLTNWTATLLIETLLHYRKVGRYLLHDFVVMPEHLHLILTPTETLERAMQMIKGGYSRRAGKVSPVMEIWQKGYTDHRVRGYEDYLGHRNYIWQNPVKRGLCERPEDYPLSSAGGRFELDTLPQRLKPFEE